MQTVALSCLIGGLLLSPGNGPSKPAPVPSPFQDGRQNVLDTEECSIKLLKSRIVVVGASQTGILEYVEPGELGMRVVADQKVAKIRDKAMRQKLAIATKRAESTVEIEYAKSSLAVAEQKFEEMQSNRKSYSKAEAINLRLEYRKATLQLEKAEFDAELAKLEPKEIEAELENYVMTAPIGGLVTGVMKQKGESVRQGDDILEITDVSEIQAIGRIPVRFQRNIRVGTPIRIQLMGISGDDPPPFDNVFEGKITYIDFRMSKINQELQVYAVVKNQLDQNGNYILREGIKSRMKVLLNSQVGVQRNGAAPGRVRAAR